MPAPQPVPDTNRLALHDQGRSDHREVLKSEAPVVRSAKPPPIITLWAIRCGPLAALPAHLNPSYYRRDP